MHITADLDLLLRDVATAFRDVLRALLDDDRPGALLVLDRAGVRRAHAAAAREDLRSHPWVPSPQVAEQLGVVDDVERIGALVDSLARAVAAGDDPFDLTPARRMEVAVLLDAGGRRWRQLLAGPAGRVGDAAAYRECGAALFEVADHTAQDRSTRLAVCGELALLLLQTSRHAVRAA